MSRAVFSLPVPAAVPEFLTPRIEGIRKTLRAGRCEKALGAAQDLSHELATSHGPLHVYALHALELVAFCAQLAGRPILATEVSVYAAAGWQRVLGSKHRHVRQQTRNAVASWLTVTNAAEAARTGTALIALLQSVYGLTHPSASFVKRRLNAITGTDQEAASSALQASGPALLITP
ncbi:hypothetical protein ACIP10_31085 [Streptomyces galbus]|uniref:hypothetical protein n=1 Tax=Streptomyces galbus TaxID=33898 RepID=UPI0038148516